MSEGKYLSLEEARKKGKLDRFIKEHPSKADKNVFPLTVDGQMKVDHLFGGLQCPFTVFMIQTV